MRLLLVEDDNHVAAALSAVLARHGFDVTHARSGEEALQALVPEGNGFGVVLLDLGLPDQDGYEVCGKIRKRTSTPVIMVTARSDVRSRIHGLNLGADDYVVKPYDTGELLARIHAVSRRTAHEDAAHVASLAQFVTDACSSTRTSTDERLETLSSELTSYHDVYGIRAGVFCR